MAIDLEKFEKSPHLLDILIQCEDVLDSLDIYVFKNWFEGEIVEGPMVRRHWLSMSLLYPYEKMPDPRAALRLHKHGVRVKFSKVDRAPGEKSEKSDAEGGDSNDPEGDKNKNTFWLVKLDFPRLLVGAIADTADVEEYEDEVDVDDVQSAKDSGLTDESGYVNDDAATQENPDDVEQRDVEQGGGGRAV